MMKSVLIRTCVVVAGLLFARMTEAQEARSNEIFAFNSKVKIVLVRLQKEMSARGDEAEAFSNFERAAITKSVDEQESFSVVSHSMSFRFGAEMMLYPPDKDGNLLSPGGRWKVKATGVVFELFVTDRLLPIALDWRKEVSVAGKEVTIGYNLELGSDLVPLNETMNRSIQETLTKGLLP